jgi:Putative zinc-finger
MNHPKREAWVPYLFGEAKPEARKELQQHLQSCPVCRAEIDSWKHSLDLLDAWQLPRAARPREAFSPVFRWAVAAAVVLVLGVGFTLGRLTPFGGDQAKLREMIEPQIRQELRAEFVQMLHQELAKTAATLEATGEQTKNWLAQYARSVDARIETERAERLADCLSLKKDVDTIAINADAGLRNTEQKLAQLADYRQPARPSNQPNINPVNN